MQYCTNCGAPVEGQFCTNCGQPMAQPIGGATASPPFPAPPPPPIPPAMSSPIPSNVALLRQDYATWGNRAIAYLLDSILVFAAICLVYLVLGSIMFTGSAAGFGHVFGGAFCFMFVLFPVAWFVVGIYNRVILVAQRGYSLGMGVMKIKVVDGRGQLLTQSAAVIRLLAQIGIALFPFGGFIDLLWPLWDPERQTLHDKAVGSYVINNPGA